MTLRTLLLTLALAAPLAHAENSIFDFSLQAAKDALAKADLATAEVHVARAIERDPKSPQAWALKAEWAGAKGDLDEQVHAMHVELRLLEAQKQKPAVAALRKQIVALDPAADALFKLRDRFLEKLLPIAKQYEQEKRPHSAIRALRTVLAIDPENAEAQASIERISAKPDPSLAESAKPKDLLADVSEEWMRDFDSKHADWKARGKLDRENYVTHTDGGYEIMVRSAEAMEQVNAFYRRFFHYGEDGGSVGKIELRIFKNRDEYLKLGSNPPEWSGGQFIGSAVETYVGDGGFTEMVGTLFHEAAHQFVSMATSASGWLNEGLASFFEGTRILANGTVLMNMPANHRLFPLVDRMNRGWMKSYDDGIDPNNASAEPQTAPTWQIILENKYGWGPPWYAPTWGVVYFLYNYQDPEDGRFVYRAAFHEFIDSSGGRTGEGAVENFEKVVLANPQRPTPGHDRSQVALPKTCTELNEVWKQWMIALADEQSGKGGAEKPYLKWARCALERHDHDVATEHFEKGLVAKPDDVDLLVEFADHLFKNLKNPDRASKLLLQALSVLEPKEADAEPSPEAKKRIDQIEDALSRVDPKRMTWTQARKDLATAAQGIVDKYLAAKLPLMAMEVSWRLGTELELPALFTSFDLAARSSRKSIALWQLAYNEENLRGWAGADKNIWVPYGQELLSRFREYDEENFDYSFLAFDKITSGDFSFEAEIAAEPGKNNYCGLVFGRKAAQTFHALIFSPGHAADGAGKEDRGAQLTLSSFFGASDSKSPAHVQVGKGGSAWHKLRVELVGNEVDVFFDGRYVMTHAFASADALRGAFGLITGTGSARFREVRYLARERRDPGAAIERAIRLEEYGKTHEGGRPEGSLKGTTPPAITMDRWLHGGFEQLSDLGACPKLLVFTGVKYNETTSVDRWLKDLHDATRDVDLQIVLMLPSWEPTLVDAYFEKNRFPFHVGVDTKVGSRRKDQGATFDRFGIVPFEANLPRFYLLDIDDTVVAEGDPGLIANAPWEPGQQTYLDDPLAELVAQRNLRALKSWNERWKATGEASLEQGDIEPVLPLLKEALDLPDEAATVARARAFLREAEAAMRDLDATAELLADQQAEAAMKPLLDWAAKLGRTLDPKAKARASKLLAAPNAKAWDAVLAKVDAAMTSLGKDDPWPGLDELEYRLGSCDSRFGRELSEDLREAVKTKDLEAARKLLGDARRRPAAWLAIELANR